MVPFVVFVLAAGVLLCHDGGDQGLELGDVGVDGVGSVFAHKHKLGFKAEFVFAGSRAVLFLEGREEFGSCFAVFEAGFVLVIDRLREEGSCFKGSIRIRGEFFIGVCVRGDEIVAP